MSLPHEVLAFVPRMQRLGWNKGTLNAHIGLIQRNLPGTEQEKWLAHFADPDGYIEQWIVTLISLEYAERQVNNPLDSKYMGWRLKPYTVDALHAAFERDWTAFDSVLGIWELSEAKD